MTAETELRRWMGRRIDYLFDALFNELYHEHPELWPWIREKYEEFKRLG